MCRWTLHRPSAIDAAVGCARAILFLGERLTPFRAVGVGDVAWPASWCCSTLALRLARPRLALSGNGLLLAASLAWAASMLHPRAPLGVDAVSAGLLGDRGWPVALNAAAAGFEAMLTITGICARIAGSAIWDRRCRARVLAMAVVKPQPSRGHHVAGHAGHAAGRYPAFDVMLGEPFDPTPFVAFDADLRRIGLISGQPARVPRVGRRAPERKIEGAPDEEPPPHRTLPRCA